MNILQNPLSTPATPESSSPSLHSQARRTLVYEPHISTQTQSATFSLHIHKVKFAGNVNLVETALLTPAKVVIEEFLSTVGGAQHVHSTFVY